MQEREKRGCRGGTDRGFTGHEHLDDVGIVHMNGRIYDPHMGRFVQPDPYIQDPLRLQNLNRYSYVLNNPLNMTDPSGEVMGVDDLAIAIFAIAAAYGASKAITNPNLRVVVAIAAAVVLGPYGTLALSDAIAATAVAGFSSGMITSGDFKGGLRGAATALVFYGIGQGADAVQGDFSSAAGKAGDAGNWGTAIHAEEMAQLFSNQGLGRALMHAAGGCVTASISGDNCGRGALTAGFGKLLSANLPGADTADRTIGTARSAVIGGTLSTLGGGKFANGAMTGAFQYLFNQVASSQAARDRRFYAAEDGAIETVGWENPNNHSQGYGFRLKLRADGDGSLFVYAHVDPVSLAVSQGQLVTQGQLLGQYASPANGGATGPHLHFEWWSKSGTRLDPASYLTTVMPNYVRTDWIRFRNSHPVTGKARWHNGYDLIGP